MSDRNNRPSFVVPTAIWGVASMALWAGSTALAQSGVSINEVRVDQPGLDLSEYVEFAGTAGSSLTGLTLLVIGDNDAAAAPAQNGTIEAVVALEGTIPASGLFVLAESTFLLGTADQVAILNFENPDDLTFLLVSGFTGADGQDLDTNDDGTLDVTPWSAIESSVAIVATSSPDGVTSDFVYSSTRVGPDGATSPSQAWRCSDTGAWMVGAADPALLSDTAGAANPTCGGGASVRISEIRIDMPGNDLDEYVELEGAPGTSLTGYTYIVIGDNNTTGAVDLAGSIECVVNLDGVVIPPSGFLVIAESTYTLSVADVVLAGADPLGFENSDNVTHMLVTGFTGLMGADLDVDNNCVVDSPAPWASIADSVVIVGLDTTCEYSPNQAGPDTVYTPGMVYRCYPDGNWEVGGYSQFVGSDTPGAQNRACGLGPVPECGEATTGACDVVHTTPFCADSVCCSLICTTDAHCCTVAWDAPCVAAALTQCNQTGSASCARGVVSFNEIRIDQTGTDNDEWVEMMGTPGLSLADLTLIVIGDGGTTLSGTIEAVVSLAGQVIPTDGHFSMSETTFTQGIANIDYVLAGANPLNFENSDNVTFMLVRGFTGANAQDLDTDNNGTLDATPWTEVVDSIALILTTTLPPVATEWYYGPNTIGPDGTFVPGHVWRCEDTGCWNIGPFDIVAAHDDTPGVANWTCGIPCPGDIDLNGAVDGVDLTAVLAGWGGSGPADLDGDGVVGGLDLTVILANWGQCD